MKEPSVGISTRADALDDRVPREEWILGRNPTIRRIAQHAERAATVGCTVLVTGETGTGKEVWARRIHQLGGDSSRPFVPVNCAALTATLAESQLFGHEKGAFTGALGAALGVFRAARGGVVFLDEVGEMPLELQPKLLRVLQENEVTSVGSAIPVPVNVQIVAATNRNLEEDVANGNFREDLYFRLNMVEFGKKISRSSSSSSRSDLQNNTNGMTFGLLISTRSRNSVLTTGPVTCDSCLISLSSRMCLIVHRCCPVVRRRCRRKIACHILI